MATAPQCPQCGIDLEADVPHGLCPECLLQAASNAHGGPELLEEPEEATSYATPFAPPAVAELSPLFPQLEILELLGQGGMGAVYKARQRRLDRLVALKILPPQAGRDPAFAERFTREARALARLSYPHIVAVHDFGEVGGLYYFIMEFVDGVNLRYLMAAGRLEPVQTWPIITQVCEALQYAHDEGIVHRDIKPENILLDKRGRLKIADFGLAKLLGEAPADLRLTGTRQVMGTPNYMAPEQLEKPRAVDHRADIYSLGVVFYEMLTGELPLGRFALPSQKAPVDGRLDEVVLRALEKEPDRRYQQVSELSQDVATIANAGPSTLIGPSSVPGIPESRTGGRVISVPVSVELYGGVGAARGLIRLEANALSLEYVTDYGLYKSRLKEATIPLSEIGSISLKRGRLTLTAHRFNVLAAVPGSSPGHVELSVAKKHRDAAEQFVAAVERQSRIGPSSHVLLASPTEILRQQAFPIARPKGLLLGKVKAMVRSVLYYCVGSIQKGTASLIARRTVPPGDPSQGLQEKPEPAPKNRTS
jgi:serine/threonine protein kinase